jgi:hypothetical protein
MDRLALGITVAEDGRGDGILVDIESDPEDWGHDRTRTWGWSPVGCGPARMWHWCGRSHAALTHDVGGRPALPLCLYDRCPWQENAAVNG